MNSYSDKKILPNFILKSDIIRQIISHSDLKSHEHRFVDKDSFEVITFSYVKAFSVTSYYTCHNYTISQDKSGLNFK